MSMTMTGRDAPTYRPATGTAILWIVTAVVSWTVSFLLYREYIGQLTDAPPMLSCNISPFITCGPNLLAPAGNLLMTIPLFWSVAGWTLQSGVWGSAARRVGSVIRSWLALIVVVDYAVIAVAAQVRLDLLSLLA